MRLLHAFGKEEEGHFFPVFTQWRFGFPFLGRPHLTSSIVQVGGSITKTVIVNVLIGGLCADFIDMGERELAESSAVWVDDLWRAIRNTLCGSWRTTCRCQSHS